MLDGVPVLNIGAGGLVAVIVLLVLSGRLVPKSRLDELRAEITERLDDLRADTEARLADKDAAIILWRSVAETSQAQMAELLEHSRLTVQLLTTIEARAKESADRRPRRDG